MKNLEFSIGEEIWLQVCNNVCMPATINAFKDGKYNVQLGISNYDVKPERLIKQTKKNTHIIKTIEFGFKRLNASPTKVVDFLKEASQKYNGFKVIGMLSNHGVTEVYYSFVQITKRYKEPKKSVKKTKDQPSEE